MPRRLASGSRLVIATHNPGKLVEIGDLLTPFGIEVVSAGSLGLPEPEETGDTFIANAALKALAAATASGLPALSDDSGLCVEALDGAPGIYSARWAGPAKDFAVAIAKINHLIGPNPNRRGQFVAALALAWPDGTVATFEGRLDGHLVWPPRGERGFGYDPIFQPDGEHLTCGEMEPAAKHAISHRARAFHQLVAACFEP